MTTARKLKIARAISKVLDWNYNLPIDILESRIKINPFFPTKGVFSFPVNEHFPFVSNQTLRNLRDELSAVEVHAKSVYKNPFIHVEIDRNEFVRDVLAVGTYDRPTLGERQKLIVEFSSPNIAKPFHFGHLRSTLIGNFIANINQYLGNDVVRINYLGDWGVQFGLLKAGIEICGLQSEDIAQNPVKTLLAAYVKANSMIDESPEVYERAKQIFHDLEFSDDDNPELQQWKTFRQYTLTELARIYERINVKFDEYSWESNYSAKRIKPVIDLLKEKQIVREEVDGALVTTVYDQTIPVIKQDGTTLYLSRDIAAVLDRYNRYKFDKMIYVVDTVQRGHFISVKKLLERLESDCASKIEHVPFGRVIGLSTRKGQAVWLDDILNDLYIKMEQKQKETPTTKVSVGGEITNTLAISCLITYDLKQKRNTHYSLDIENVLKIEGFTGARLQYCHCRLHSLMQNCGISLPTECRPELLPEQEALKLVNVMSRFNENVLDAFRLNEACVFVNYLFELCESVNQAFPKLKVKGYDPEIASQRLLLFVKAKHYLNEGMKIIGIKPLNEM